MALNRDTVGILNLALLCVMVFCGEVIYSAVTKNWLETAPVPEKTGQPVPAVTKAAKLQFQDDTDIKTKNLFGAKQGDMDPALDDLADPALTELKLRLWGTVTDEGNRHTYAVIEDIETHRQGLYRPGASIRKAIVIRITREAVVLSVDGREKVLTMASLPAGEPDYIASDLGDPPEQIITLNRSLFEQALRHISYTMNPAGLTRYTENDQNAGMLITTLWPNSVFQVLGLQNGDVLTWVAGKPVASAKNVATLFEDLRSSANTAVQIKRQNRLQTLTYDIY